MKGGSLTVTVLPITVEVDGALVHILEILRLRSPSGDGGYVAVCKIEMGGIRTRNFPITFRTQEELREKLRTEVAKIKITRFLYGDDFVRGMVS